MRLLALTLVVLAGILPQAQASELDPIVDQESPQGLVVQISPDGKREVYKAILDQGIVDNSTAAANALKHSLNEENKVESVTPLSELDQTTSDESWHWSWNPFSSISGYFSYNYHRGRRSYSYYPSFSYSYGGYQYNYYYSSAHYGYRSGYRYSDSCGYHYGRGRGWHGPHRY